MGGPYGTLRACSSSTRVRPGPRSRSPRTRGSPGSSRGRGAPATSPRRSRGPTSAWGSSSTTSRGPTYDRRPPLHAETGRAASFIEAPIRERHLIWHDAPERVLAQSPWAALLVSLHGTNIHTRYVSVDHLPAEDADIVRGYLADQRALQDRLIAIAGTTRAAAERQAELLFALDALSLSLCHGWPERELPAVDGVVIRYLPSGEREALLDPWPFAEPQVRATLGARTLTERFTDERTMQAALANAPSAHRSYTLRPA